MKDEKNGAGNFKMSSTFINTKSTLTAKENLARKNEILNLLNPNTMPSNYDIRTNNPHYYPLYDEAEDWFQERKIDQYITDNSGAAIPLSSNDKLILKKDLESFRPIIDQDTNKPDIGVGLIVNPNIAINNLIETPIDEINEGEKIMNWIEKMLRYMV